jgi:catechol 2,3-dioxygenase-like lactoylglutathione lyase family enzyme
MELGAFSISLAVKDIAASRAFYEKFGFKAGHASKNWLILKNGPHVIGLFQGMFEKNSLTFNPGWDSNASKLNTLHRRSRSTARIESTRCTANDRSRRDIHGTGECYHN